MEGFSRSGKLWLHSNELSRLAAHPSASARNKDVSGNLVKLLEASPQQSGNFFLNKERTAF